MSYKIGARSQTSHYVTIAAGNLSIIATPSTATKNARHPRLCCGPCQDWKKLEGDKTNSEHQNPGYSEAFNYFLKWHFYFLKVVPDESGEILFFLFFFFDFLVNFF